MSLEFEERRNKEILLAQMALFTEELKKWCAHRGLRVDVPSAWPVEGSIIVIRNGNRLEIKMVGPDNIDSFTKLNRVWGLVIEDGAGSKAFIARWPESWRSLNIGKLAWSDIDFGAYMEGQLSIYFGIEARPASASQ